MVRIGGWFFLIFGLIFMIIGINIKIMTEGIKKNSVKTDATITNIRSFTNSDGESDYIVEVSFEVDGVYYSGRLDYYDITMDKGDRVTIYYNPDNPSEILSHGGTVIFYIFLIVGGGVAIIGGMLTGIFVTEKSQKKKLIQADIVDCITDYSIEIDGKNPYFILRATYIANGEKHYFNKKNLEKDLSVIIEKNQIKTVPVYVNPENFSEYNMDISGIEKLEEKENTL